jgi:glycosyltransferase involved in cell wall biosynthesis
VIAEIENTLPEQHSQDASRKQSLPAIAVNARFLSQRITGVQRYAREILQRLPELEPITPGERWNGPKGQLWEQFLLPGKVGKRLLWSPCNVGPWAVRNQVVTIHDCAFHDVPQAVSRGFRLWYSWLLRRLGPRVRRILTVSEFSRQRLIDYLQVDPKQVVAIPNGVDERFNPTAIEAVPAMRARLGLPERYVLFVGSLDPRKNLLGLLKAWDQVSARLDCPLVICGASSHVFRSAGIEQLPARVMLSGYVADEDLPALYAGAELFVYPSLYEGFGLPVIEAMACGTPVVCSSTTSLGEVAGNAACLVDPADGESMAHGILRAAEDQTLRRELRSRGLDRAAEFSWKRAARETWGVLLSAASTL